MKRRTVIAMLICTAIVISLFSVTAGADMGPKPSVIVTFENMGDMLCYATLLSKTRSTGPYSAWNGSAEDARYNENEFYSYEVLDHATWKAFAEYEDADGYYFLQTAWRVSETKEIAWTYYPPESFKILLYYPETQTFAVSGIYEKYAFDTYYTVNMEGVIISSVEYDDVNSSNARIEAYRSYNYKQEIISLIARIVITIFIEMVVALLFGFRNKGQLLLLVGVNTATQILLNVLLNMINYNSGQMSFVFFYILFEIIVFALESVLYCVYMKRVSEKPRKTPFYVLYSLIANGVSFAAGMYIAQWLPGIF